MAGRCQLSSFVECQCALRRLGPPPRVRDQPEARGRRNQGAGSLLFDSDSGSGGHPQNGGPRLENVALPRTPRPSVVRRRRPRHYVPDRRVGGTDTGLVVERWKCGLRVVEPRVALWTASSSDLAARDVAEDPEQPRDPAISLSGTKPRVAAFSAITRRGVIWTRPPLALSLITTSRRSVRQESSGSRFVRRPKLGRKISVLPGRPPGRGPPRAPSTIFEPPGGSTTSPRT